GSATFLTRSTAVLATLFFLLTLGMATYASRAGVAARGASDLGVVSGADQPAVETPAVPAAPGSGEGTASGELPAVAGQKADPAAAEAGKASDAGAETEARQAEGSDER
ncbi:MAG: preprotein translocase subunit SecG, partial [Bacteroidia bacterium]|nr:preprotein translocase subunit SecG [Bacteroidia bacterium]